MATPRSFSCSLPTFGRRSRPRLRFGRSGVGSEAHEKHDPRGAGGFRVDAQARAARIEQGTSPEPRGLPLDPPMGRQSSRRGVQRRMTPVERLAALRVLLEAERCPSCVESRYIGTPGRGVRFGHEVGCPLESLLDDANHTNATQCQAPPRCWSCSREPGHDGPCAARATA